MVVTKYHESIFTQESQPLNLNNVSQFDNAFYKYLLTKKTGSF